MTNVKLLNPDFTTIDEIVDEAMQLLYRIEKINDPRENATSIYSEVVRRFGAWRISLARMVQRECRDVVKARVKSFDDVGELPRTPEKKVNFQLIEGIKKILDRIIEEIGELQKKGEFKSDSPDYYFSRYRLEIDLKAAFIRFGGTSQPKRASLKRGSQAYLVLSLLLKKKEGFVTYEEILAACGIKESSTGVEAKGMDIFKRVTAKFKKVGIGSRRLKYFVESNKGYRLISKASS